MLPEIKEVVEKWSDDIVSNIYLEDVDKIKYLLAQMVDNITRMKEDSNE